MSNPFKSRQGEREGLGSEDGAHGGGRREEVVVLRGVDLAPICFVFFLFVFVFLFFFCFCFGLIVGVGWWVLILISLFFSGSLVGFNDLAVYWVGDDLA